MSTDTIEKPVVKKTEPLLSKRRKKFVTDPLNDDNPITIQVLGICSALAVTVKLEPTFVMSCSVVAVIVMSNLIISSIRDIIPNRVRIIVQLAIIASLVVLVDQVLKNCIIMGRLEAFAMANKPYDSILDGFGSGFGYAWIILTVAFFRELFGSGSVFNFKVFEAIGLANFPTNGLMVSPIGAFMILGLIIWIQRTKNGYVEH